MSTKKNKPRPDDKEQSIRFIEKAKEIQRDNADEAFEETLVKIIRKKGTSKREIS